MYQQILQETIQNDESEKITMLMKSYSLIIICVLNALCALGESRNPYYMMGCNTPVLDYTEPSNSPSQVTEVTLPDGTKARLKEDTTTKSIVILAENNDTLTTFTNDGLSVLRFLSIDKLAEETPGVSPYAYCNGNPVCLIDPTGLKPTETEAARMAHYVYQDEVVELIGDWVPSSITDYNFNQDNGLKSLLFEKQLPDGTYEYALVFAGTDNSNFKDFAIDVLHDILQSVGLSNQYWDAMNVAKDLTSNYNNEITFVGHSLGGGLSAASAFATNGQAITFNAAWVSPFTRYENNRARIDAYITTNDPLDKYQRRWLDVRANGNIILRNPKPELKDGHTIKNFY